MQPFVQLRLEQQDQDEDRRDADLAELLAERPDTIWYATGVSSNDLGERLAHLEILADELGPQMPMAYVDPGSTNPMVGASGAISAIIRRR